MAPQKSSKVAARPAGTKKGSKVERKHIIDVTEPSEQRIFDVADFEKFLNDNFKVEGRRGNLGDNVKIAVANRGKIEVTSKIEISGRYLKYLTKKYLKKQQLRDWLRVVSTTPGNYTLRYFNVTNDEEDEEDDE